MAIRMSFSPDTFLQRLDAALDAAGIPRGAAPVLAAVSGGADSMALLHGLVRLGRGVAVAHFDHQTRDGASAEDARFVAETCGGLGLRCLAETAPVADLARARGHSFEEEARLLRYAFFRRCAGEWGMAVCVTGHHADDQAETVLLRILRGSGPRGLAGIAPARDEGELRVVRPLLGFRREELRGWLEREGLSWREDATNARSVAERNRVRNGLLPELAREHNPEIVRALARLAEAATLENAHWEGEIARVLADAGRPCGNSPLRSFSLEVLRGLSPALRRRVWAALVEGGGGRASHEAVTGLDRLVMEGRSGAKYTVGAALGAYLGGDCLYLYRPSAAPAEAVLPVPGEALFNGRRFSARRLPPEAVDGQGGLKSLCGPGRQVFDGAAVPKVLLLRGRRPGDRFRPLGMQGDVKLQDYFVNRRVPEPVRDAVPLVTAAGRILWVVGHAPAARAAVTGATAEIVEITVHDAD